MIMVKNIDPFYTNIRERDSFIRRSDITDWIEGSQMDEHISMDFLDTPVSPKKKRVVIFLILISFCLLASRVGYLQIVKGAYYRDTADRNRQRIIPIPSERGLIFDINNVQLTTNVPSFSLALIPQDLPRDVDSREILIQTLAKLIQSSPEEIAKIIEKYGSYSYESIILKEDLDYKTALSTYVAAADIPGIYIYRGSKRLYSEKGHKDEMPLPSSMSHILGYLGKLSPEELETLYPLGYLPSDIIGKIGIEKSYERFLRGSYGSKRIEVDSVGKEQAILAENPPISGSHIILTIDLNMQRVLEDILKKAMDKKTKTRGVAIAMDPRNGSILAMVSLPVFNNNDFSGGIDYDTYQKYILNEDRPLFNRAISGTYPSGSTIKPALAAAALQEKIITPNTTFLSTGGLRVGSWFFPDWRKGGHGRVDIRKSLEQSVNTFYYYIGGGFEGFVGLGIDKITQYLIQFGFSSILGIDIPSETAGFIPSKQWKEKEKGERWYVGDTYNLSIGQGDLLITPLQLNTYISSIANGGTLYKPHLVEKIIDITSGKKDKINKEILRYISIDRSNMEIVRLGMRDCVEYGSCRRLSLLPFSSAGKTGTAQWSSTKEPHAWFTAFAPYENPEISITILVEEGVGGNETAVPIAFDFLSWWGKYKNGEEVILDE